MEKETVRSETKQRLPHQFKPGVSGNPNGRPKGIKSFTTKVREALEAISDGNKDTTNEKALIKAIMEKAIIDKDVSAQKLIWNYLDGLPTQRVEQDITTLGKSFTEINYIVPNAVDNKANRKTARSVRKSKESED